jgi:hypothetical protein
MVCSVFVVPVAKNKESHTFAATFSLIKKNTVVSLSNIHIMTNIVSKAVD